MSFVILWEQGCHFTEWWILCFGDYVTKFCICGSLQWV